MAVLARWKWENYSTDIVLGRPLPYHFNSDQPGLHASLIKGDTLWVFGDRPAPPGKKSWVLLARLHVQEKKTNRPGDPGYKYGKHGILGDRERSAYFDPSGPDVTDVLMRLQFKSGKRIQTPRLIGNACQALRPLTAADNRLLEDWASNLNIVAG